MKKRQTQSKQDKDTEISQRMPDEETQSIEASEAIVGEEKGSAQDENLVESEHVEAGDQVEGKDSNIEAETADESDNVEVTEPVATNENTEVRSLTDTGIAGEEKQVVEDEEDTSPEDDQGDFPRRRMFSLPTRAQIVAGAPFWAVIFLGAILRFWGLGDKPLHHDESLHAYFSLQLMHNNIENWLSCFTPTNGCYKYDPLLHGPFQFHAIALVYKLSQWLGAPDHGVNTTTVRIAAATLGTVIVGLPYFVRDRLGTVGAWLACFLLAVSPSMVYFSRFAREDIYMACFTLLLVVATARYLSTRKPLWLLMMAIAFSLSYATKEATFLTIAVFGSFLGALVAWELGARWLVRESATPTTSQYRWLPQKGSLVALVLYLLGMGIFAKVFFGWIKSLSIYVSDPTHTAVANDFVKNLETVTFFAVLVAGVCLGAFVVAMMIREIVETTPRVGRRGLAKWVDPQTQPLLDTIVTSSWLDWVFALLCAWGIFLILYSALFTNIEGGIGDGIWRGLYYWLQQQQVARGGQPWYYYFLLIPLYEQIGLVFSVVGCIRCLVRPTRFRLFLVVWYVGNLFLYSWAAEKMPWLMIHITMPMMLLAAIGLEPAVSRVFLFCREAMTTHQANRSIAQHAAVTRSVEDVPVRSGGKGFSLGWAIAIIGIALILLLPTLQNMFQVSYVHQADGPHEMMIYVQTTPDVDTIMTKVDTLDQRLFGGQHKLSIGLTDDATWPFAWYLRDYTNVCFRFPDGCPTTANTVQVIITGGDSLATMMAQYAVPHAKGLPASFVARRYHMRTWWDEGYKPPPCSSGSQGTCSDQAMAGYVGPWLWLSYGDNPPAGAKFNPLMATSRIWQWWWQRKPLGSTDGSYDMALLIRSDLGEQP